MFKQLLRLCMCMFLCISVIGCTEEKLENREDISSIEVYDWSETTVIETIHDKALINNLMKALENASISSTTALDYPLPPYKVVFMQEETRVFSIGYYEEAEDFGVEGQYLDVQNDVMYGVQFSLPIHK